MITKINSNLLIYSIIISLHSCNKKQPQEPTQYSKDQFLEYSKDFNKTLVKNENKLIEDYIKKENLKFIKTNSGFYMTPTSGKHSPKDGDKVIFTYSISDLNNNIIYKQEEIGEKNIILGQTKIPIGLEYSIKRMSPKEKSKIILPSFLAYGLLGDENKITKNQVLIININLINTISK